MKVFAIGGSMREDFKTALVEQLAEPMGMGDVDEMPEVIQRAIDAGKKLGQVLKTL